jgi:hypothetical protein
MVLGLGPTQRVLVAVTQTHLHLVHINLYKCNFCMFYAQLLKDWRYHLAWPTPAQTAEG